MKKYDLRNGGIAALVIVGALIFIPGLSWIITCVIIKLITMCFAMTFRWSVATGVWLILVLLQAFLKSNTLNNN